MGWRNCRRKTLVWIWCGCTEFKCPGFAGTLHCLFFFLRRQGAEVYPSVSKHLMLSLSIPLPPSLPLLPHDCCAMDKFFNDIQKTNKKPTADSEDTPAPEKKALPKGVVLGKDGKPYVYLLHLQTSKSLTRKTQKAAAPAPPSPPGSP